MEHKYAVGRLADSPETEKRVECGKKKFFYDNSFDLLKSLKKTYNHFDMGVYLTALDDGQVNIGDNVSVK